MVLIESFGLPLMLSAPSPLEAGFVQTGQQRDFVLFYALSFLSHWISGATEE